MVCGILSLVVCLPIANLVLAIIATALSTIAIKKANAGVAGGKGMAIAGLICGIIGLVWGAIHLIIFIVNGATFVWAMNQGMQGVIGIF